MSSTIFPQEESGNFMNPRFISIGVQLDTTAIDNAEVKSWYADAHAIMNDYAIQAFPTYLVFAPDGHPVHRMVGSLPTAKSFIAGMKNSFDSSKQYYTQLEQFRNGRRDSAFLRRLADQSLDLYATTDAAPVVRAWFATQASPYTREGMHFLQETTRSTNDEGFTLFLHHAGEVNKILGPGSAERMVNDILFSEYISPVLRNTGTTDPDWKAIQQSIAARYPEQAPEVTARGKVIYYQRKQDWGHFQTEIVAYMGQYGSHATPAELNDFAWTVFQNCPDMTCVSEALDWSKRSFKDQPNSGFMDTYANILYKLGKKDDAIVWEQKALELADKGDKARYQETINKMKKGEKTWN
jgi:hypothetical protein